MLRSIQVNNKLCLNFMPQKDVHSPDAESRQSVDEFEMGFHAKASTL